MPGPKTAYRRGADLERRIRKLLAYHGYRVIRSAGSHTPIDLIAIGGFGVRLIQVKALPRCNIWKPSSEILEAIKGMAEWLNIQDWGLEESMEYWLAHRCKRGVYGIWYATPQMARDPRGTRALHMGIGTMRELHEQA